MTSTLFVDIETFSRTDLKSSGVYRYVEDPDFEILMAAFAFGDDPVEILIGEEEIRDVLGEAILDPSVEKIAHHASFERVCFSRLFPFGDETCTGVCGKGWTADPEGLRPGAWVCAACGKPSPAIADQFRYLDAGPWDDTLSRAAEWGYPQGLERLALALGAEEKDAAGKRLINLFCSPARDGRRIYGEERPDDWEAFIRYCIQDVETLRDIHRRLPDWPTAEERRTYVVDQRINDRGLLVDLDLAECAAEAAEDNQLEASLVLSQLTGALNPNSRVQLLAGLARLGVELPNLQAETVTAAVAAGGHSPEAARALELRQELALSASSKYQAGLDATCGDGRLRGAFKFFGGHTGRWSGRGLQPHNLPRAQFDTEEETEAAILDLKLGEGANPFELKALVRALFVGPFTVVDYSAIEARVIAWIAGEIWALEAFEAGRDIYVETAERMSTPRNPLSRSQGKVAVLALGYNGGIGALRAMGAEGTDADLQKLVTQWRAANVETAGLWKQLDGAFRRGGEAGRLRVDVDGPDRYLRLPSGRAICYRGVRFSGRRASFLDPKKPGLRTDTYGGKLAENATQAVARDLLAAGLVNLDDAGVRVVGHVHDEVIVEGGDVGRVTELMCRTPAWAEGLPIDGAGFQCRRYRKEG